MSPGREDPSSSGVDKTLVRVVLLMRLLSWVWLELLVITTALEDTGTDGVMLAVTGVVGTIGTILLLVAVSRGFLGSVWYMVVDGVFAAFLLSTGWLADASEFFVGGYPMSWVFVVAYTTTFPVTMVISTFFAGWFAALHLLMGLRPVRAVGSIQFIVVAAIVGWAFSTLRERESLRLRAEAERTEAEAELAMQRQAAAVLEERVGIARKLHDSVLQTLKLIATSADDANEVKYLARVQERDLRRTINEYRSQYGESFRARLLDARAAVEDQHRVQIEQVIRDDAEMTDRLAALVDATTEAMVNAARHSGSSTIDLFAEVTSAGVTVHVRDRGCGFDPKMVKSGGLADSVVGRMHDVGGRVNIKSGAGLGTDIELHLPAP